MHRVKVWPEGLTCQGNKPSSFDSPGCTVLTRAPSRPDRAQQAFSQRWGGTLLCGSGGLHISKCSGKSFLSKSVLNLSGDVGGRPCVITNTKNPTQEQILFMAAFLIVKT